MITLIIFIACLSASYWLGKRSRLDELERSKETIERLADNMARVQTLIDQADKLYLGVALDKYACECKINDGDDEETAAINTLCFAIGYLSSRHGVSINLLVEKLNDKLK